MGLIVVAGTPGTGKSFLGSRLARVLNRRFTTVSWLVFLEGLWVEYDASRRSFVVDDEKLVSVLRRLGSYVVETHWLEVFEDVDVEFIVLTRCNPLTLVKRLKARSWPLRKIAENVEAELVGVIASEAAKFVEKGIPVYEVDTTERSVDELVREVLEAYRARRSKCCVDWLEKLSSSELNSVIEFLSKASVGAGRVESAL